MNTIRVLLAFILINFILSANVFAQQYNKIKVWDTAVTCEVGQEKIESSFRFFYQDTARIHVFIPNVSLRGQEGGINVLFPTDLNQFVEKNSQDPSGISFFLPINQNKRLVQEVKFRFSTINKKDGSYNGEINAIINKRNFVKLGNLEFRLITPAAKKGHWALAVLVLAVGAFLSWLMAIKVPEVRRRRALHLQILNLRAQTDELTNPESSLNRKLRRKVKKVSELNQLGQFSAVEERIKETEEILSICRRTQNIDNRIKTRDLIPMDLEDEVERLLEEVYIELEDENIESAKNKVDKAFEYFDRRTEKIAEFKAKLVSEVNSLSSPVKNQALQKEISRLKQSAASLDNNLGRIIELNRDFRIIKLILQMEKEAKIPAKLKHRVKYLLSQENDFVKANELIQIEREGFDEEYYKALIKNNKIQIVTKGDPYTYSSLTFELLYKDPKGTPERINNSLLATQKFTYEWNFDDGYIQRGKSTVHFFKRARRYKVTLIIKDPQGEPIFTSSDACTAKTQVKIKKTIGVGDLKNQKYFMVKRHFADMRVLDFIAFAVGVAIAGIIGLQTHYINNATFGSFDDYTNLFLWGFSLDTAKNGFLSVMKGLEKGMQK
jgi:hypothetical protein